MWRDWPGGLSGREPVGRETVSAGDAGESAAAPERGRGSTRATAQRSWRPWLRHYLAPHGLRLLLAELGAVVVFAVAVVLLTAGGPSNHAPVRRIEPASTTIPAPVNVNTTPAQPGSSRPRAPRTAPSHHRVKLKV